MEIRCDSNISESELEGERTRALQKLQVGALLIRSSDDGSFRCPFCLGSKTQNYKLHALFQHASSMAASSKKLKEVACHQAVVKFLLADLGLESHQPQVPTCGALGGNEIILRPTYDLRNVCQDNGKMILTLENDKQLGELLGQGFRERNTKCESERRKNEEFNVRVTALTVSCFPFVTFLQIFSFDIYLVGMLETTRVTLSIDNRYMFLLIIVLELL